MTARKKTASEPQYVLDVFGPCPDCEGGKCEMNCGAATITFRELIASCVIQIEKDTKAGRKTRDSFLAMLGRINPALKAPVKSMTEKDEPS